MMAPSATNAAQRRDADSVKQGRFNSASSWVRLCVVSVKAFHRQPDYSTLTSGRIKVFVLIEPRYGWLRRLCLVPLI